MCCSVVMHWNPVLFFFAHFITHMSCILVTFITALFMESDFAGNICSKSFIWFIKQIHTCSLCILLVRRAHIRSLVNNNAFINKIYNKTNWYALSIWILRNCDELNHIPLISICIRNVRFSFWFKSQFAPNACSLSCKKCTNNLKRWDMLWLEFEYEMKMLFILKRPEIIRILDKMSGYISTFCLQNLSCVAFLSVAFFLKRFFYIQKYYQ